ncbi:TerD family protein [Hufsiella ginkgonis]|uniref:Chemical-damaging agent resistance protein C n=1 Tax=Hufsiella ginkgonis TaxID=2695274 RepID=A0A7K1XTF9_9SPHI|nr:TerD family protein [Hufsiella ginkgonis]MXV14295.1 chemical-damaging agent resistance protein C [Hufsiella ginkgonis]
MANFKLQKGERFSLSKAAPGLKQIKVGMGWNPNEQPGGPEFDLDVSAFAIGSDFRIPSDSYFVFYGQVEIGNCREDTLEKGLFRPVTEDGAITGAIDDPDGRRSDGDDDEDMLIDLDRVNGEVEQIIICCTVCKYPNDVKKDRRTLNLNFGQISGCYIRIVDQQTGEEIARYDLKERFTNEDAIEFGRLFRAGRSWEFEAMGRAHTGSLQTLVDMYT